jgi:AraC-like DNA-binding protein
LGQVLERFQRYQSLIHNLSASTLTNQGEISQISWDPLLGRSTQASDEALAAGFLSLARILTGLPELTYASVAFIGRQPADPSIYEQRLGCPVRFGSPRLDLKLPASALALPIASSDPHLMGLMEQQAKTLLQVLPQPDELMNRLRQVLMETLQDGEPTCERMATLIGISERTLNRRLQERGTNYKSLLTDLRKQLVAGYLADAQLSLPDIAHLLGYSEQSALTRAFKGWFGVTPLRYRRALLENVSLA